MDFLEKAKAQIEYMRRINVQVKNSITAMPEGSLVHKFAKGHTYFYASNNGKLISLQDDPRLRQLLMEKRWLKSQIQNIEKDIPVLERLLRDYAPLFPNPMEWELLEGEQNQYKKEERRHYYKGVYFRSKSEVLVAMVLDSHGLEYKYEVALHINGRTIYPDFVIKRKRDGKIFIWEHFGLIFSEEYRQKMYRKIAELHEAGFNPWDNLLMSFDSEEGSIDVDFIERMIKLYLL